MYGYYKESCVFIISFDGRLAKTPQTSIGYFSNVCSKNVAISSRFKSGNVWRRSISVCSFTDECFDPLTARMIYFDLSDSESSESIITISHTADFQLRNFTPHCRPVTPFEPRNLDKSDKKAAYKNSIPYSLRLEWKLVFGWAS